MSKRNESVKSAGDRQGANSAGDGHGAAPIDDCCIADHQTSSALRDRHGASEPVVDTVVSPSSIRGAANPCTSDVQFNMNHPDWLNDTEWEPSKENIILVHGYAGGDDTLPIAVLRDAYVNHGGYNVFLVDWGALGQPPCYVAAVYNIRPISACLAKMLMKLRALGLPVEKTTCVGHSLGAHICGLMANYLNFRLERIIALDPARPLMKPGNVNRLDSGDAKSVQVIHTNAGHYGEGGRVGHIDFCINGGRRQPYCGNSTNINLCSHIWAICYLAQSVYDGMEPMAEPCHRRCPTNVLMPPGARNGRHGKGRFGYAIGYAIPMGQKTPLSAFGSYCVKDPSPPFCSINSATPGDKRCCI